MSAAIVFETFFEMQEQGHTIIIVTHDREIVRDVPSVLHMKDGLIDGTVLDAAARRSTREHQAQRVSEL
jgi:ABC-type lipoprotein export system ATPase subunit